MTISSRAPIRAAVISITLLAPAVISAIPAAAEDVHNEQSIAASPVTQTIETDRVTQPVAPGVTLDSFDRWGADGWLRADALTVDLAGGATVDYLGPDTVSSTAPISEQVTKRTEAVAAVNGDFFDINDTGAANGVGVSDGELVKSANTNHRNAVSIDPQGVGRVLQVDFEGTLTTPDGQHPLAALNTNTLRSGTIGEYTSLWGAADRSRVVEGATRTTEVVVTDGTVTAVSPTPGSGDIPTGAYVLLGRESGADTLAALAVGDQVSATYSPRTSDGSAIETAVGGNQLLLIDGEIQTHPDDGLAARSAIGFSADGATMYLLTVDGKQADSVGLTVPQMAEMMKELGAHNAINIDGGGSSTMLARQPGATGLSLVNGPSDGSERPVANGLAISVPAGSADVEGYWTGPAIDDADAPGDAPMSGGRPDRVFPGLTRQLTAAGYDETFAPATGDPRWRSDNRRVGTVDGQGVFHAKRSGTATVTAYSAAARGTCDLTVLGELDRIASPDDKVGLADASATGHFGIVGYDAAGFSAPIEPGDISLKYDQDLLSITADATGFAVTSNAASVATLVSVEVGHRQTIVPVTVGLTQHSVAEFDDVAGWKFSAARATGSLSTAEGHTGPGLGMNYDFTQSTATRAAYATPASPMAIPGQPQSFSMWIKGQGNGEWPSLHLVDGTGSDLVLRSDHLTWEGWQEVGFTVPAGAAYPLSLKRFYVAEVAPTASYRGAIVIDDLVANLPPAVDVPDEPALADPIITSTVDGRDWRFAVMSDAQFVARDPDSDIVVSARRTLQEIKAAAPDFLIINGDLVDEGSPADLAFARQVLTEELGDSVPWYYVPGNHEVMGGKIDNFVAEFGPAYRSFDHKGTRFITLDTSGLKLRTGGFDQLTMLRDQLDAAETDPAVNSVVVVEHVPPRDPLPQAGSQLSDRKDAQIVEEWLSEFAVASGKGIGFVGAHVGAFHAAHVDGVPYLINGNSGKSPAAAPEDGGFIGWTEFGVEPLDKSEQRHRRDNPYRCGPSDWLTAQTHAQIDELTLETVDRLTVGDTTDVVAQFSQQDQIVPVAYPVSADWSQSKGVHIGTEAPTGRRYHAWFNPATGTLKALRKGEATLVLTVNGMTQDAQVTITG